MQIIRKTEVAGVASAHLSKLLRTVAGALAVTLALIAIFPLAVWAEAAAWHHALQHVLIFSAGAGLSASVLWARRPGKERE